MLSSFCSGGRFPLALAFTALILCSRDFPANAQTPDIYAGNATCGSCHSDLMHSYMKTAMAHASGAAPDETITGGFHHQKSGVDYSVTADRGKLWLKFHRAGDPAITGGRELLYFIGSGRAVINRIPWYSLEVWETTSANAATARRLPCLGVSPTEGG